MPELMIDPTNRGRLGCKAFMKRRHFLKLASGCAAAIGFPTIIPASALGRDGRVAPSNRITMGFIGVGGRGTSNMRVLSGDPGVQPVALCDVDRASKETERRGLLQAKKTLLTSFREQGRPLEESDLRLYGDFRELVARNDIDAVSIATPDHWHGLISIAAIKAGKDVYCEKPLANSIREGRAVCDAARRYGRVVQTGSHERSNDSVRYACELVRNGRIGKIKAIRVNLPTHDGGFLRLREAKPPRMAEPTPEGFDLEMWLGPAPWAPYHPERCGPQWRYNLDTGGGEITDRGAHVLDLVQYIAGCDATGPVDLQAQGRQMDDGIHNCFLDFKFEYRYANGIRVTGASEGNRGFKVEGETGWIFVNIHGGRLEASSPDLIRERIDPGEIHEQRTSGHHQDFLECVRTRRRPVAFHEIGHRTSTVCHLINLALLTGRRIVWDPEAERITNDECLNRMVEKPMRAPWRI